MSNDKTTLADVQPGGRVRLGDGLPPLPPEVDAVRCMIRGEGVMAEACDYYYTAEQMQDYARAALSTHPSPGGQGALVALVSKWRNEASAYDDQQAKETGFEVDWTYDAKARALDRAADELESALAARQPVGEPVAFMVRWKAAGGFGLEWPKNMKYFRDRVDEYEIVPLQNAAPPAQAVDLSPSQSVLAEVAQERARQEAKWGQQNHVDWTPTLAATDLAGAWPAGVGDHFKFITDYKAKGAEGHRLGYFDILMEEVAEAHDEARDGNTKATRAELVQVAAVAVAWIECIDRRLALIDSQVVGNGTDR